MNILKAIFQALIQGFTEFLPVSSSGHLSLFQHFLGITGEEALTTTIVLHLGTLLAVFLAFYKTIGALIVEFFSMVKDIFTGKFKWKTMNQNRRFIIMIVISILPLFVFYIFKDVFEQISTDSSILIEGLAFLYTSALLFLSDRCKKGEKSPGEATVKDALTIGTFQGIALVPGISRSGSTICSALFCGLKREAAVEYSFILGIPVILAGAFVNFKDLIQGGGAAEVQWGYMAIGFVVAAISGFLAIKLVRWLVKTDRFKIFAVYTLILGIIVLGIGIFEHIVGMNLVAYLGR